MTWTVHDLGGIDLLDTSAYYVEITSNPPEERIEERYVPLNSGSGARLAQFMVAEAPAILDVICVGTSRLEADENRDALQDVIDDAINGSVVTYSYQEDASQPEPTSWRIIGGKVRARWRTGENEEIFSVGGRYFSLARVLLTLSKA